MQTHSYPHFNFNFFNLSPFERESLRLRMERGIHTHKSFYVTQAVIFIVFGIMAAIVPGLTAMSVELIIGALLLASGFFQLILSQWVNMHWWSLFSSLLSIGVGGWMLLQPVSGLITLVALLAFFLVAEGIFEILLGLQFHPLRNWGWMVLSGIIALALGILLWAGFPELGVLYVGLVIAINLILYGASLLMLVFSKEHL